MSCDGGVGSCRGGDPDASTGEFRPENEARVWGFFSLPSSVIRDCASELRDGGACAENLRVRHWPERYRVSRETPFLTSRPLDSVSDLRQTEQ